MNAVAEEDLDANSGYPVASAGYSGHPAQPGGFESPDTEPSWQCGLIGGTPQHDAGQHNERQDDWYWYRIIDHEPSYELPENVMAPTSPATPLGPSIDITEDLWHEVSGMHGFSSLDRQMTSYGQDFRPSWNLRGGNILARPGFEYLDQCICLPVSVDSDISTSVSDTHDSQGPLEWLPGFQCQHHHANPNFLGTHPHMLYWTSFGHGNNLRLHLFQEETSLGLDQRRESLAPASLIESLISRQLQWASRSTNDEATNDEESESAGTAKLDEIVGPSNEHETHGLLETGVTASSTEIHTHGGRSAEKEQPKKRKHQWEGLLQPGSDSSVPKYRRQEHEIRQAGTVFDVFQNNPSPADYTKETARGEGSDHNSKLDGDADLATLKTSSSEERSSEGSEHLKSNPIDCQPENFRIHATYSPGMKRHIRPVHLFRASAAARQFRHPNLNLQR